MISLGFVIALLLTGLWALGSLIVMIVGFADDYDKSVGWVSLFSLVFALGVMLLVALPFDMAYHSYRPVQGEVEAIDKRLLGGKDNLAEKYAIRFADNDQIYGCEDTRCSVAKPGDTLKLNCIRDWQWASVHGYNCRYAQ